MDPQYARAYRDLYQRHWWWRAREALILKTLRAALPRRADRSILDVGCGDGLFFDKLAEFGLVEGVEADPALIDPSGPFAKRIYVGPFDDRFQPERQYGLILMLDVLEHLEDPLAALQQATDLLDDDGLLVITVPAFEMLWTAHDDWNRHYTRYTKQTFDRLALRTDLQVLRWRYFFHWMFVPKLAVRLQETLVRQQPRPARVPPAAVNRGLYALSRLEQWATSRFPLPAGSSLLVVAGKCANRADRPAVHESPCAVARQS